MVLVAMSSLPVMKAFIRPLPAPSRTMSMKMPHDTAKPVRQVRSLLRRMLSQISMKTSLIS